MKQITKTISQKYHRLEQDHTSREYGCMDDSKLVKHHKKIDKTKLEDLIVRSIDYANLKSSREAFKIPEFENEEELKKFYKKEAWELFKYFHKYCDDPASTSHNLHGRNYVDVCKEAFRNRVLQKQRMNSGWRYQSLAKDCAIESGRFRSVSDVNSTEADFNVVTDYIENNIDPLTIYVSVKNRINTLGGQDWPKAIHALEHVARNDKNRQGPYLCVFGIVMDRGTRTIKREGKSKRAHSENTEVWLSDFFWPFFSNNSYDEIMSAVLDVLLDKYPDHGKSINIELPDYFISSFGEFCKKKDLINDIGVFDDPKKIVMFFCSKLSGNK